MLQRFYVLMPNSVIHVVLLLKNHHSYMLLYLLLVPMESTTCISILLTPNQADRWFLFVVGYYGYYGSVHVAI